jgi:tetratricopeptide (TPR) repeat protein
VHNLPLQFAAETGLVGLLLAGGAAGAALLGAARALRRLGGVDREAAAGLAVVLPTFLVHSVLDYDWEFVALCAPLFFATGYLLAAGREQARARGSWLWAGAAALVALALLYSLAAPPIAARRVDSAYSQIEDGSVEKAIDSAKSAHALNPLSVEPLYAWAAAEEAVGNFDSARARYLRAIDLQPLNWDTWYELGRFDVEVIGDDAAGRRAFRRALELNPHGCPPRKALGIKCENESLIYRPF